MTTHPQIGDVIAEKYLIEAELGRGGMGTVFSATHLMTGRRFALKWMNVNEVRDAEGRERFIREFQTSGSIVHANVRAVLDVGTLEDSLFIVMEYLEGESLAEHIARGPMRPSECVPILLDAMRGVAAAHQRDIVHRDLKPDNIFLCHSPGRSEREIKVLDFGILKAINARAQFLPTITARGTTVGTPPYMAPEQVMALPTVDHRADIYAFGVILYEALSGTLPFYETSRVRLAERIVKGHAPPLSQRISGLPAGLEAVVMRALEREPSARYPSLSEFASALAPWATNGMRHLETAPFHAPAVFDVPPTAAPATTRIDWRSAPPAEPTPTGRRRPNWSAPTERFQVPPSKRVDARSLWLAVLVLITGLLATLALMRQPPPARRSAPVANIAARGPAILRPAPQPGTTGPPAASPVVAAEPAPEHPVAAPPPAAPSPPPPAAARDERVRTPVPPRASPAAQPRVQPRAAQTSVDVQRPPAATRARPPTRSTSRRTSGVSLSDF
jgi:serine/threonine-protein kinase